MAKNKTRRFTIPTEQFAAVSNYMVKKKLTLDEFAQLAIEHYDPEAYCAPTTAKLLDCNAQLAVQIMALSSMLTSLLDYASLSITDYETVLIALQDLTKLTTRNFEKIKRVELRTGRRIGAKD